MRFIQWFLLVLLVVAGLATAFSTYQVSTLEAKDLARPIWQQWVWIAGSSTAVLGIVQKILDSGLLRSRRKELQALRAQFFKVFDGPLGRLFDQVASMAAIETKERPAELHAIRHAVVAAAAQVVGSDTARATYFRVLDVGAMHRVMTGDVYNYSDDRPDNATSRFNESDVTDREVWGVLDTGVPVIEPNLKKKTPATWNTAADRKYMCFVTYRVHVSKVGVGLLTVNTSKPEELTPADLSILKALASLLGAAETIALSTQGVRLLTSAASARIPGNVTTTE